MSEPLPKAPATVVDEHGHPRFGAHVGEIDPVHWNGLRPPHARSRLWRAVHAKRWHYASIAGPDVIAAFAIVDIGWAANAFAYLFDRRARVLRADLSFMGVPRVTAHVADGLGRRSRSSFSGLGVAMVLERVGHDWSVRVRGPDGFSMSAVLGAGVAPTLCAICEIDGGVGNCTQKSVGLPVRGTASAGGARFVLDGHTAALDHTNGLLARDTRWRWASAASPGIGLNLVQGFNGPVENVFWIGDQIHPAGAAEFSFDAANPGGAPWHIRTADGSELTFTPEGSRRQNKNLIVAVSRYVQPFGTFSGVLRPKGRPEVPVRDLAGVTEDHIAVW